MLKTYGRNKPYLFWFGKYKRCKMGHFAISIIYHLFNNSIYHGSLHDNLYNRGLAGVRKCGHTNVAITFERMNIFTCGKKQMVAWIKAVTGGGLGPGQGPNNI